MTPEQFCYWLQGRLEDRDPTTVQPVEVALIQEHLKLVFQKVTPAIEPAQPGRIPLPLRPMC